jgi:hypothetical protein
MQKIQTILSVFLSVQRLKIAQDFPLILMVDAAINGKSIHSQMLQVV